MLTVFSVFFLPLTFIVGVYGMNFEYMPELRERWGYPAVLLAMAVVTLRDLPLVPPARLAAPMTLLAAAPRRAARRGGRLAVRPPAAARPASRRGSRRTSCRIPPWSGSAGPTAPRGSGSPRWTPREGEPHAERVVDAERLSVAPDRGGGPTAGARARSGAERGRADGGRHAGVPCRRRHRRRTAAPGRLRRRPAGGRRE